MHSFKSESQRFRHTGATSSSESRSFLGSPLLWEEKEILGVEEFKKESQSENGSLPLQANAGSGHDVRLEHVEGEAGREVDEDQGELADQLLLNLVSTW